jgi:integrase
MPQGRSYAIYNRQSRTSKTGKTSKQYVLIFAPGQHGKLSGAALVPPFYIRYQSGERQWVRLEARTIEAAKVESQQTRDVREAVSKGMVVESVKDKARLAHRVAAFLEETEANKAPATWAAYDRSLELFQESCKRLNIGDVRREDLLQFTTYLKKLEFSGRTIYNHFLNVCIFLAWAKHPAKDLGIKKGDWPGKPERIPEAYTEEEINKMLKVASGTFRGIARKPGEKRDDRLLLKAFLNSGLRDGELQHLSYADIDVKHSLWTVRTKEGQEVKTRDHKLKTVESQRRVPVGADLTKKIMERKDAEGKSSADLIFPNTTETDPDSHLLRVTQRIAELAGIEGRVDNHKFRATVITTWLRSGIAVPDVMEWVGHKSSDTVLLYYAKVKLEEKEHRQKATQAFARFSAVGD